eukprot:XP_001705606.1 Hypothetical protein GL50803_91233 [Giardia lamblia ATCC 50803]
MLSSGTPCPYPCYIYDVYACVSEIGVSVLFYDFYPHDCLCPLLLEKMNKKWWRMSRCPVYSLYRQKMVCDGRSCVTQLYAE